MKMYYPSVRRLCVLLDELNVMPEQVNLSPKDIIELSANRQKLFHCCTETGRAEALALVDELLPEAEVFLKAEVKDQRTEVFGGIANAIAGVLLLVVGILAIVRAQEEWQIWFAMLPIFGGSSVLALIFIIGPIVKRRSAASLAALDKDLFNQWAQLDLLIEKAQAAGQAV